MDAQNSFVRRLRQNVVWFILAAFVCVVTQSGTLDAQTITRGPYLQVGTPSSIIVRWQTDVSTSGRVWYGTDPANLGAFINSGVTGNDHAVTISGLTPDTRYFYAIGTTSIAIASGATYKFVTSPPAGNSKPTRVWVIGDAGTGTSSQTAVRDAYTTFNGTRETDLWLVLGDNAYNSGTEAEYQAKHFAIYPNSMRNTVSWYTLGNHDAGTGSVGAHPYHTLFSFPTAAEAGGVASGTRSYYSFDYGNLHFISLDSQEADRTVGGAMRSWLQSDLQSNTRPWVIAFWHHPPYSKGTHDSDTEVQLVEMRANFLPLLEQHGVDLVLSGHSHVYERSYLIDGHYGTSGTFAPGMKLNGGSGRPAETGAYGKPSTGPAAHEGAVYVVAGSSGQTGSFFPSAPHPAMFISLNTLGSMVLDVNGNRVDASFLRDDGVVADTFTLVKGTASGNVPPSVALSSPGNGSTFANGATISLTATATDSGGIAQVAYYSDGGLIGTAVTSPFAVPWSTASSGPHRLTARATDNGGLTHISAPVFITVSASAPPPPPAAPSMLLATSVSGRQINLQWTDNAGNETGFRIERSSNGTSFTQIDTTSANVVTYANIGLMKNRFYNYRVRATNANGDSAYSNIASAKTSQK